MQYIYLFASLFIEWHFFLSFIDYIFKSLNGFYVKKVEIIAGVVFTAQLDYGFRVEKLY